MKNKILIALALVISLMGTASTKEQMNSYNRIYAPGTYEKQMKLDDQELICKVYVDNEGLIKSVYLDRTSSDNYYYFDEQGDIYIYVEGDTTILPNTYRYIGNVNQYSALNDDKTTYTSITNKDLVCGLNDEKIASLKTYDGSVVKSLADQNYKEATYQIAQYVIKENGIYGLDMEEEYPSKLDIKIDVSLEVALLKELLEQIEVDTLPYNEISYMQGVYEPGSYTFYYPTFDENKMNLCVLNIYINEYGYMDYIDVDSVSSDENNLSFRKNNSSEYANQISLLEKSLINNQSSSSYKLYDSTGKIIENGDYKDFDQVYLKQITGFNLNVKYLLSALNTSFNKLFSYSDNLIDGTHYVSSGGNMMSIVVKDNQIVNLTIDSVFEWKNAKLKINDKNLLVYTYDRFKEYDLENQKIITTKQVIFSDGVNYYYLIQDPITLTQILMPVTFGATYTKDDGVEYTFDEQSTITKVYGNLTKQNSVVNDNLTGVNFYQETNKLKAYFLENQNPYSLNILDDGTTDSINISIPVRDYVNLFALCLKSAQSGNNIYNVDSTDYNYDLEDASYKLANGSFYGMSEIPSGDSNFYLAYMTITDDEITSIVLDSTVYEDFHLSTNLATEYDNYFIDYDDPSERVNFISNHEALYYISNYLKSYDVLAHMYTSASVAMTSANYDYDIDNDDIYVSFALLMENKIVDVDALNASDISILQKYGYSADKTGATRFNEMLTEFSNLAEKLKLEKTALYNYLENYEGAINNCFNQSLSHKFATTVTSIDTKLNSESQKYLVYSDDIDEYTINLDNLNDINNDLKLTDINFENNDTLRINYDEDSNNINIKIRGKINTPTVAKVTCTYGFADYDDIEKNYSFTIVPMGMYLKSMLEADDFSIYLSDGSTSVDTLKVFSSDTKLLTASTNYLAYNEKHMLKPVFATGYTMPILNFEIDGVKTTTLNVEAAKETTTSSLILYFDIDEENNNIYDIKNTYQIDKYGTASIKGYFREALANSYMSKYITSNDNKYIFSDDTDDVLGLNVKWISYNEDNIIEHVRSLTIGENTYLVCKLDSGLEVTLYNKEIYKVINDQITSPYLYAVDAIDGNAITSYDNLKDILNDGYYFLDSSDKQSDLYVIYDKTKTLKVSLSLTSSDGLYDDQIDFYPRVIVNDELKLIEEANQIKEKYIYIDATNSYDLSNIYDGIYKINWYYNNEEITVFDYQNLLIEQNAIYDVKLEYTLSDEYYSYTNNYVLHLVNTNSTHYPINIVYLNLVDNDSDYICVNVNDYYVRYDRVNEKLVKVIVDDTKDITSNDYIKDLEDYSYSDTDYVNGLKLESYEQLLKILLNYGESENEDISNINFDIYYLKDNDSEYNCLLINNETYVTYIDDTLKKITINDGVSQKNPLDNDYLVESDYIYSVNDKVNGFNLSKTQIEDILKSI